ncbi:MAG: HD domain-containing protein [Gemmatimonadaceae bacterium]|nr:HD domain-containing protein [Gemmatimonadaceae bacterium]
MKIIEDKIKKLKNKISQLYESKEKGRDDWADWLYNNHIFLVANLSGKIAEKYGANKDISEASAMLHDIADAVMDRDNLKHEEKTLEIAEKFLKESWFSDSEILIVEDALKFHSCHGDKRPQTLEGRIMAAADGMVHLQSDFYEYALRDKRKNESLEKISKWAIEKINRDFNNKILFKDLQKEVAADYKKLKDQFIALRNS